MRTLLPLLSVVLILSAGPARSAEPYPNPRTRVQYLSGQSQDDAVPWQFLCTANRRATEWTTIPVPSCWEFHGFGNFNYGKDDPSKPFEQGKYKHTFKVPSDWADKRVFIVFDGVMTDAEVKLNGQPAGPTHRGAFYRFKYEITDKIKVGDQQNLLEVTVSKHSSDESVNRAERQCDFWVFGGIYRPVWLEAVPKEFIERVAIDAKADGTLNIDVFPGAVTTANVVHVSLFDAAGKPVGEAITQPQRLQPGAPVRITAKIASPALWTSETPNLYAAKVSLMQRNKDARLDDPILHQVTQRFGFRTIEVKKGDGVYVNGKRVILQGCCRHSFWPDSGRTTSRKLSEQDVALMKDMNMNAVRMSHYPPDEHFLDVCDEQGLYVLDELTGWQKAYSTEAGRPLVEEMIKRDVNHPSIILWDNGNEGGWNRELDDDYARWDPQKREVIHPWEKFRLFNTKHYPTYKQLEQLLAGDDIVLPTEFLHGLYDGGHGAGLADYWRAIRNSPRGGGGFLWVFSDEGAKRDDWGGKIDVVGNFAPDGILGPYREKEGSFYTIKELWSPVVFREVVIRLPTAKGIRTQIEVENRYQFTDLSELRFEAEWIDFAKPGDAKPGAARRAFAVGNAGGAPGGLGGVLFLAPPDTKADAFRIRAIAKDGREVACRLWPLRNHEDLVAPLLGVSGQTWQPTADRDAYKLEAVGLKARIDRRTGALLSLARGGKSVGLTGAPRLAAGTGEISAVEAKDDGVHLTGSGDLKSARWSMTHSGVLRLDYEYANATPAPILGVTFDFPEDQIASHRWLGRGPYRVWKNRMEGGFLSVHETAYNDTQTGYKDWVYPEFKGYFADWHWSKLTMKDGTALLIATDTPGLFLRLGTPAQPDAKLLKKCTTYFPPGNLSFLHGIAPIGNKFHDAKDTGPQGQPHPPGGPYRATVYFKIEAK